MSSVSDAREIDFTRLMNPHQMVDHGDGDPLHAKLTRQMNESEASVRSMIAVQRKQMRAEVEANMADLRAEAEANMADLRAEAEVNRADLRAEIGDLRYMTIPRVIAFVSITAGQVALALLGKQQKVARASVHWRDALRGPLASSIRTARRDGVLLPETDDASFIRDLDTLSDDRNAASNWSGAILDAHVRLALEMLRRLREDSDVAMMTTERQILEHWDDLKIAFGV